MFPFVLGKINLSTDFSTALVSDISQWSRACCMLRIFDWATAWIDYSQAPSYCVNWLFTNSTSSTSHRGFPRVLPNIYGSSRRSLGLTYDLPRTYDLPQSPTSSRIDEWGSWLVRIAPVNFLRRLFVHLTFDSDWFIYYSELNLIITLVSFTGAPKFLTLT